MNIWFRYIHLGWTRQDFRSSSTAKQQIIVEGEAGDHRSARHPSSRLQQQRQRPDENARDRQRGVRVRGRERQGARSHCCTALDQIDSSGQFDQQPIKTRQVRQRTSQHFGPGREKKRQRYTQQRRTINPWTSSNKRVGTCQRQKWRSRWPWPPGFSAEINPGYFYCFCWISSLKIIFWWVEEFLPRKNYIL